MEYIRECRAKNLHCDSSTTENHFNLGYEANLNVLVHDAIVDLYVKATMEIEKQDKEAAFKAEMDRLSAQHPIQITAGAAEREKPQVQVQEWAAPPHREADPFDADYDDVIAQTIDPLRFVKDAVNRGFHVFGLQPKSKITLPGSHGFKDGKKPSDPDVFRPWNEDPSRNIGIALGESDVCVLDFDTEKDIPEWLNQTKTYKVKTSRGVHVYFRGARPTTGLYVGGKKVGDIKSTGGYVLAAGSVHPDGPIYTVIDDSPIASAPDLTGLLKHEDKAPVNASPDGPPIPYGSHDNELTRIAGLLRNASLNPQDIEEHLIHVCERRCEGYGSDYREMCRKIAKSIGKKPVGQAAPPIKGIQQAYETAAQAQANAAAKASSDAKTNWLDQFRSVDEMEDGPIVMVINGVLQEGICFIGANPGDGKTWVALAFAKAISTGTPLFDMPQYDVPMPRTVIYLIPESRDRAFRKRCEAFEMPKDKLKFMARTISAGAPLQLSDPNLLEAVRQTKAVVFLDTAARFMRGTDENAAAQNRLLEMTWSHCWRRVLQLLCSFITQPKRPSRKRWL
jgi:hypothetical protein